MGGGAHRLLTPPPETLTAELLDRAHRDDAISRCLAAIDSGCFAHPDGRTDPLLNVVISRAQAALISHMAHRCPSLISVEVGFGMGSSAAIIMGTRRLSGQPFEHVVLDPFGLSDGRGVVVESYLTEAFGAAFRRIRQSSEVGLGQLVAESGRASVGLVMIDGGHHFEQVVADFVLADRLCCVGGVIVLDDAWYPAIEALVNYVRANRADYAIADVSDANMAVLQKVGPDRRAWSHFQPFEAPRRADWTPSPEAEAQIARRARSLGLELHKSPAAALGDVGFGNYKLVDTVSGAVLAGGRPIEFNLTLIEAIDKLQGLERSADRPAG